MSEIAQIVDAVWSRKLERDPVIAIRLGLPISKIYGWGIDVVEDDARFARGILNDLAALDRAALSDDEALTASFLQHSALLAAEAPEHHFHTFSIAPYAGGRHFMYLGQMIFAPFGFETTEDADRYIDLVGDYARLVREVAEKVNAQIKRGILLPRVALPAARATYEQVRLSSPGFLIPSPERVAALGTAGTQCVETVRKRVEVEVDGAFELVLSAIGKEYEDGAPHGVGLAQYAGGLEAYRHAVRLHNTVDLAPEEIHQIGVEAIEQLVAAKAEARARMGFTGSEADFREKLRSEPRLYAATPEEVEGRYLAYMARLEPLLSQVFSILPEAPYGVARLEPELEPSMTYGYYEPPVPGRPEGRYRYNASQLDQRSLLNAAAIIYHELAPGHHFHLARQQENLSLPDVRRYAIDIGAYNEGWAEYAAGLGWELGLYDDPLDEYGKLAHESFIAQRLVVDTGMNALGWSLDKARSYMSEHTFESDLQVATETVRYSTDLPAQALGYHLGHRAMRNCRARAEAALGKKFDVRDFHETVLGSGALPLPVLDEHVDRFIERVRG